MKDDELNELKEKIQAALTESQTKLSEITAISDNSKQKETELNTYHSRIIELKAAAETNATTLTDTLNAALALKKQVDEMHAHVTDAKSEIDALHQDSSSKTNEINSFYSTFQDLKQKVENPESGISSTLTKTGEILGQIVKTNEDATKSQEEILSHKIKSEGLLSESSELKGSIETKLTESEKLKLEIGKILDLVRDTGLANSFDRRRKRSQTSCLISLGVILVGVGVSAYLVYTVFLSKEGQALFDNITNDYIKFLLRLTLTAPGVFMAWFGAVQYSKERFFLEQYEFKTAAALALENYTKLLKDNYGNKEEEIFKLNLELIRSVYKEPTYIKPNTRFSAKIKTPKTDTEVAG